MASARLGIDGIELHCAHAYLLHQFLSPFANQRTDEYGGSRENRMRYPLEIFDAVRAAFPDDKPVGMRVSATDWVEGGWTIDDTIAFAAELKKRGVDWVDVSSSGVSLLQKIPLEPGYQVPFAQAVKEADRRDDCRGRSHYRSKAGERDHLNWPCGLRRDRARHALRCALAVARGSRTRRYGAAAAILAIAAARAEGICSAISRSASAEQIGTRRIESR